jgi:hypothetical protein
MPACVESTQVAVSDVMTGAVLHALPSAPDDLTTCAYVVETGPEYVAAVTGQDQAMDMFFAASVVVLFALGWIAGAQR